MNPPRPVILEPILKPKVWGGRRLASLGKAIGPGELVGESWELADLDATSPSGGGGESAISRIARRDPLAGTTVRDLLGAWGERLTATLPGGRLPMLVKYLDAREHLSVQVHPSPAYAAAHPEAHLKSEAWLVLEAEPGSVIYSGLRDGCGRAELEAALGAGTVPSILRALPARVGECHSLPSGTIHALGAGVLVAEVQTPSDTTFRVYDWAREYGRAGRELHVEQALEAAVFEPPPNPVLLGDEALDCGAFVLRVIAGDRPVPACDAPAMLVVMALAGPVELTDAAGSFASVEMEKGETALVPACCAMGLRIASRGAGALVARAR